MRGCVGRLQSDHGRKLDSGEQRLVSHVQGYDLMSWVCDKCFIGNDGPGRRIHKYLKEIVAL
jgi:hypothetical protein